MDRRLEVRTILLVMMATCVPALAAVLLIATSSQPDLADLDRVPQPEGGPAILTWSELSRDRTHSLNAAPTLSAGTRVLVLGYMTDYGRPLRADELVHGFLLLPEAGNFLHPAHRAADQMIAVHLAAGHEVPFANRHLVLVTGTLRQQPGNPAGEQALFLLNEADARLIERGDVGNYYK